MLLVLCPAWPSGVAQGGSAVGGMVRDLHGTPQMGALIELLGPDASVVAQTYTDDHGRYLLSAVSPGRYQLRASAAFLLPSLRSNLRLTPGVRALADLTMSAMVEIGAWFPAQKRGINEPDDDWRWTLRSTASRPLLRLDDDQSDSDNAPDQSSLPATQARLTVVSGQGSFAQGATQELLALDHVDGLGRSEHLRADLGQASFSEANASLDLSAGMQRSSALGGELRVVAAISSHPELSTGEGSGLQAFTLASSEHMALGDAVMIDAGTLLTAERLVANRVGSAPFLRVVIAPATGFALMYRYASERALQSSEDLDRLQTEPDLLSDAQGSPAGFGNRHQELAFTHTSGDDTEMVAVYQDDLANPYVEGLGVLQTRDLVGLPVLADLKSNTFRAAVEGYQARGFSVAWTRQWTSAVATTVTTGMGSTLERSGQPLNLSDLGLGLGLGLAAHMRPAVSATVHGAVKRTSTGYSAQYGWQPSNTLDAVNAYNTLPEQGYMSCSLRQKLWSGRRLKGLDAVLEATNLLEEGYQPVVAPDGETIFLAQVPRSMQAGLSFKF